MDNFSKNRNSKGNILGIIVMVFLFGVISYVTNLAGQMLPILKNQFNLSNAMGSLGNMANFIAYAVMGIPGVFLLQRMKFKKTALAAVVIGFAGVSIQYLAGYIENGFWIYLLGAFVSGFSMCLLNMVVNPMLNELGGGGRKGARLLNIGGAFNSLSGTAVVILVGAFVGEITANTVIASVFPVMYIALAVFGLGFIILNVVNIPEPSIAKPTEPVGSLMKGSLKFLHFVLGAVTIFVYVGVEVGIPTVMNAFLTDVKNGGVGLSATTAGFVVGTYWFLMLLGRIIGGAIGVSSKTMLTVTSSVSLILVMCAISMDTAINVSMPVLQIVGGKVSFGFADVPINAVFLVLTGLCASVMWPSIFNLAVEGLGKYLAVASGIFMTMVCGGGILQWIQAKVADLTSYMASYWVVFAGFAFILYYALKGSKKK